MSKVIYSVGGSSHRLALGTSNVRSGGAPRVEIDGNFYDRTEVLDALGADESEKVDIHGAKTAWTSGFTEVRACAS